MAPTENGVHGGGQEEEGEVPRLRIITAAEVDGLAELKEPVEAQAREQAREILEDIKVRASGCCGLGALLCGGDGLFLPSAAAQASCVADGYIRP